MNIKKILSLTFLIFSCIGTILPMQKQIIRNKRICQQFPHYPGSQMCSHEDNIIDCRDASSSDNNEAIAFPLKSGQKQKDGDIRLWLENNGSFQTPSKSLTLEDQKQKLLQMELENKRKEKDVLLELLRKNELEHATHKEISAKKEQQEYQKWVIKTALKAAELIFRASLVHPAVSELYQTAHDTYSSVQFEQLLAQSTNAELINHLRNKVAAEQKQEFVVQLRNFLLSFLTVSEDQAIGRILLAKIAAGAICMSTPFIIDSCAEQSSKLVSWAVHTHTKNSLEKLKNKNYCMICETPWHTQEDHEVKDKNGTIIARIDNPTNAKTIAKTIVTIFFN